MRIAIFGHLAAGKSTLALELSKIYELPIFHIDSIVDSERFTPPEALGEAVTYRVKQLIQANPSWIIEGITTYEELSLRANEADLIIFLNLSLTSCFIRSLKRFFRNRGKQRLGGSRGRIEVYNLNIVFNLLRTRLPKHQKLFHELCENNPSKAITLRTQKEIDSFLEEIR